MSVPVLLLIIMCSTTSLGNVFTRVTYNQEYIIVIEHSILCIRCMRRVTWLSVYYKLGICTLTNPSVGDVIYFPWQIQEVTLLSAYIWYTVYYVRYSLCIIYTLAITLAIVIEVSFIPLQLKTWAFQWYWTKRLANMWFYVVLKVPTIFSLKKKRKDLKQDSFKFMCGTYTIRSPLIIDIVLIILI